MIEIESALVPSSATIRETMQAIDVAGIEMALVVDGARRLLGVVTDGDIRRGLLRGLSLEAPAEQVMTRRPVTADAGTDQAALTRLMADRKIQQVPVLDAEGRVVSVRLLREALVPEPRPNEAVIMAGGKGERLRPLTDSTPKPLLKVGNRPLLAILIEQLRWSGIRRIQLAVGHRAELFEAAFGRGIDLGVELRYLRESMPLGTAGSLSLLPNPPEQPLLLVNGDLLTKADFGRILDLHVAEGADLTLGVRLHDVEVPFGVVELNEGRVLRIREKPVEEFPVCAGINVVGPRAWALLRRGERCDLPELVHRAVEAGLRVRSALVVEYWLDMGRLGDYERANLDYARVFDGSPREVRLR
ncbi:MAG: CBS domain-containing protein [Planctomycetes bacterium]|nr:CBS domain-containing protein [Planctomycetota bacterium]